MIVRERLTIMSNSAEKLLIYNLQLLGIKAGKSFRAKIRAFQNKISDISVSEVDTTGLCAGLLRLDDEWTFVKHGDFVANAPEAFCIKDGLAKVYTEKYLRELEQEFTKIQKDQMVLGSLLSPKLDK